MCAKCRRWRPLHVKMKMKAEFNFSFYKTTFGKQPVIKTNICEKSKIRLNFEHSVFLQCSTFEVRKIGLIRQSLVSGICDRIFSAPL